MEKSIETIWKEGFIKNDALVVPKLNDLYNQKSIDIITKLKKMFKINIIGVGVFSIILLVMSFFIGTPYAGILLFLQLSLLVFVGYKKMKNIDSIDKNSNSYQYLKSFDEWLKGVVIVYTKLYGVLYPSIFITFISGLYLSHYGEIILTKIIIKFPDLYMILGVPVLLIIPVLLIACLSGVFAGPIYRTDLNLAYGHLFKKLEELLTDMEELRK